MKYIIENCGCNPSCDECYGRCNKIDNCLLKQIVEKCKENQKPFMEWNENGIIFSKYRESKKLADEILGLLEIEEIEE